MTFLAPSTSVTSTGVFAIMLTSALSTTYLASSKAFCKLSRSPGSQYSVKPSPSPMGSMSLMPASSPHDINSSSSIPLPLTSITPFLSNIQATLPDSPICPPLRANNALISGVVLFLLSVNTFTNTAIPDGP